MALSSWDVLEYEELLTDELVEEAAELLKKFYKRMADWIEENEPLYECPECQNKDLIYRHDGIQCNCGYFKEVEVPYPAKGGCCATRTLEGCIKQLFAGKMGQQRKKEKPSKKTLRNLEYAIDKFNTGEYTQEEVKFLNSRFKYYMEQIDKEKGTDPTMIRSLVIKELQMQNIERQEALGLVVDRLKAKDIYNLYIDLSGKLKFTKNTRDNENEQDALLFLISEDEEMNADLEIEGDLRNFLTKYSDMEDLKKEAKQLRIEVGNPYG